MNLLINLFIYGRYKLLSKFYLLWLQLFEKEDNNKKGINIA